MIGRNALDLAQQMLTGQGMRKRGNETWDEARYMYRQVTEVLREYVAQLLDY